MKKKNFLWLLLIVPVFFVAASSPIYNMDNEGQPCASWGEKHKNWDGNSGCGYVFDFNSFISGSCTLTDIDLDSSTPNTVDHYFENNKVQLYTNGSDGKITMFPKSGYTGPGLIHSCEINAHFANSTFEYALWTMIIDDYPGPYPPACY